MGRLLLVRHAQSVWNAAGRWQGWSDAVLSEVGVAQAEQAGRVLAASGVVPDAVGCSDLSRSRCSAELVASELGYQGQLVVDPDLRERNLGDWNGLTTPEIMARWPGQMSAWAEGRLEDIPGGEHLATFTARAGKALHRIAARHFDGEVVVVAHGGVVMVMESALGVFGVGGRTNLSGWWLDIRGTPHDVELAPLAPVDLLTPEAETVTWPA
jgi:probable phosphoglycerate mutase